MTVPEWYISSKFAEELANKICIKVIRSIQKIETYSYESLENIWDDICVQVQFEEFYSWNLYDDFVFDMISPCVEELKKYEKQCLWLETDGGIEWCDNDEEKIYGEIPHFISEIIQYIKSDWQRLFDFIPRIKNEDKFGSLIDRLEEGVIYLQPYESSEFVEDFKKLFYGVPFIIDFDWGSWDKGRKMVDKDFNFDSIDVFTKLKLISALLRNDRFCSGMLIQAFEDGIILKILVSLERDIKL
ncbi:MAG: hypothetical protein JXQ65_07895 [Candidatus Marinimicrobia bacterium]|nr:hypothetical protein [Candidatus Neomarinimicrobiota bacterium]